MFFFVRQEIALNDTGVFEGGEISIYYDPMIAKLVTHGPSREAAIDHMVRALDAFHIGGIRHNIPFLAAIMQHPRWRAGDITTGFLGEEYPDGFAMPAPSGETRDLLAAVAAAIDHLGNLRRREIDDQMAGGDFSFAEDRVVMLGEEKLRVRVGGALDEPCEVVLLDEAETERQRYTIESDWWFGDPVWRGRINGAETALQALPILNGFELAFRGVHAPAYVYTLREAELAALMPEKTAADTSKMLLCPMPGLVMSIHVEEGQQVKAGEALCVVEAMKMENILRAERDGTVAKILAAPGDSLAVDAVIMEFE
jgi:propionyl-CoA carboxylase alpha chain